MKLKSESVDAGFQNIHTPKQLLGNDEQLRLVGLRDTVGCRGQRSS
jgi:hypothetical protein